MTDAATLPAGSRPLAGMAWMLATGLCFVAVTGIVKHVGAEVPAAQAAFLRFLLGLVFLVPTLPALIRLRLAPRGWGLLGLRGLVHTGAVLAWFFAMTRIPVVEVTAMNYLAPVYVTIGAALFLGERLAARRIAAIAAALLGALIILRPGFREVSPGHVAMLFSALAFAGSYLIAKHMTGALGAGLVVALLSLAVTVGLAPFAVAVWVPLAPGAIRLALPRRLLRHRRPLRHDPRLRRGAGHRHPAGGLPPARLGLPARRARLRRAGRRLRAARRRRHHGGGELHHLARSRPARPRPHPARRGDRALTPFTIPSPL
jgi:uncharacterized membrane protein